MITSEMLIVLAESYKDALEGTDIISALKIHCAKAGINTKYITFSGPDIYIILNIFKAAKGQNKLECLVEVIKIDGINLNLSNSPQKTSELPRLKITQCLNYLPTASVIVDNRLTLCEGRVENASNSEHHVILEASVQNTSDIVRQVLCVPIGGMDIPFIRLPQFSIRDADLLTKTNTPAILNINLFISETHALIDNFQKEIWLTQSDIIFLARSKAGSIEDFSYVLAMLVNSGAEGLSAFISDIIPADWLARIGYQYPSSSIQYDLSVDAQCKLIYESLRKKSFVFMHSEYIFLDLDQKSILAQRVRTPENIIRDTRKASNCLDGAVFFASILMRLGISPIIFLIPRHAFVGWKRIPTSTEITTATDAWNICGMLDTTFLSSNMAFDVAVSAAQGSFLKWKEQFNQPLATLETFAKIVDIIPVQNALISGKFSNYIG